MENDPNQEVKPSDNKVPSISLNDNKIILATLDVPLIVNDETINITMQKLTAGQKRELVRESTNTKLIGQQVQGTVDAANYQIGLLTKVIIKAPFDVTEKTIASLPDDVSDYLFEKYNEWTADKKKD